jgi:vacuolar-type H+-ATPase subunit I/STV1
MAEFELAEVLSPDFNADLERLPIEELRAKRDVCAELETELSYLRRLAQARIDLILAESHRHRAGAGSDQESTGELVQRLPQILGEHERQQGPGRLPAFLAPAEGEQARLAARVERVLPSEQLGSLAEISPSRLDALLEQLSELERQVSSERRALHDIQDRLQEEVVRRYRSGEADVDALLRQ